MRPPLGFVVEGAAEYNGFEPLIRKAIAAGHGRLPIANAHGNGTLRKNLEEKLVEVIKTGHPCAIIVTLDLRDAVEQGYPDCATLRKELQTRADKWLEDARNRGKLGPLPVWIRIVVQVPYFEAWLTADPEGIRGLRSNGDENLPHDVADVDSELNGYTRWLDRALPEGFGKKLPEVVKLIRTVLRPDRMTNHSRSFRKFWKEVINAYDAWRHETGENYYLIPS